MNKFFVIITFLLLLTSCFGKHNSDAQKASVTAKRRVPVKGTLGDTIKIEHSKSHIHWKGTKMRGVGKHEGEIELKSGYLIIENKQLVNGNFVIDMSTIGVTDIPEHETVPRKNLNNHLKSADFFDVEKFPTSELQITNVKKISSDSLLISGNLTLKDITKNVEFRANYKGESFTTRFTFDRFHWNISFEGSFANKTLVDKDIELTIKLETK